MISPIASLVLVSPLILPAGPGDDLTAADLPGAAEYGACLAVAGTTALIGAPGDDDSRGAVYVFEYLGAAGWIESGRITAGDAAVGVRFGSSVAIDGDVAVVGCPSRDDPARGSGAGAAYVFTRAGGRFTEQATLVPSDAKAFDGAGGAVAVSGGTVLIGSPHHDAAAIESAGAAYVFAAGPGGWVQTAKLESPEPAGHLGFATSVALRGGVAIVGADGHRALGAHAGMAYVFELAGTSWTAPVEITPGDGSAGSQFGLDVATDGVRLLVGAPGAPAAPGGGDRTGAAYVFERAGAAWTESARLTPAFGADAVALGASVSIEGDRAVAGAPGFAEAFDNAGALYAFAYDGQSWQATPPLTLPDAAPTDSLGVSVAQAPVGWVVGGAYHRDGYDSVPWTDSGGAHAFPAP